MFGNERDDIHAKAIYTFIQPELHQIIDFHADFWIFPIEIRLLLGEEMEIIIASGIVFLPSRS